MELSLAWIYAFNILVNSTLSFFTSLLLVELFVFALRIRHPRVKVFCYAYPFAKIVFDFFLYQMSNWSLLHGINPLLEKEGTRFLSIQIHPWIGIQFHMQSGETFSVADVIALSVHPFWIQGIVLGAVLISTLSCARTLRRLNRERLLARSLVDGASCIAWPKTLNASVAVSSEIDSPCVVGHTILFPTKLFPHLSQNEREAVLAHELSHLRWRDGPLRLFIFCVASFFWWIPTGHLQKRFEAMQEMAADAGIPGEHLVDALMKTAQGRARPSGALILPFGSAASLLKRRIEMIQKPPRCRWIPCALLGLCLFASLLGKIWIF